MYWLSALCTKRVGFPSAICMYIRKSEYSVRHPKWSFCAYRQLLLNTQGATEFSNLNSVCRVNRRPLRDRSNRWRRIISPASFSARGLLKRWRHTGLGAFFYRYRRAIIMFYISFFTTLVSSLYVFYVTHVEEAPITRRRRFVAFSEEQIKQISEVAERNLERYKHLDSSDDRFGRVKRVVEKLLVSNNDLPEINKHLWLLSVLDDERAAFASVYPTGHIVVSANFLRYLEDDDELAVVIAHEIAHALLSHAAEKMSHVYLVDVLILVPLLVMWTFVPLLGAVIGQLIAFQLTDVMFHLPFSRYLEMEADVVGLQLAAKACFDIRVATVLWKRFENLQQTASFRSRTEWLSTHPSNASRSRLLENVMPKALDLRKKHNCPPLPPSNRV